MILRSFFILIACAIAGGLHAQDYSAVHGSDNFGSLNVYNNPASIVTNPYKWDLTIFGTQYTTITNAVRGPNFPFNLSPASDYFVTNGNFERYADVNLNLRLLNGRFSIDRNHAFAFGLNMRGYVQANTSNINYTDSVKGPRSFLFLNVDNRSIAVRATSAAWMELYGSYAATIRDDDAARFSAGATMKIQRGMSGGFARVKGVVVEAEQIPGEENVYKIGEGEGKYGYSANHGIGNSFAAGDLFSGSKTGVSFDLGVEYIVKTQSIGSYADEEAANEYEWKIGLSLLDLGWNNFDYSTESRSASTLIENVSSTVLNQKFARVRNAQMFNDSLATIVDNIDTLSGKFKINNPARAVINVDRYISGNIFLNAEISVNLASDHGNGISVVESKLITLTPRWETRKLGVYLPVQVTRHGNFWMGGAVKLGPLLLGTHNLLNAFSKNKNIAGGAYLALIVHPVSFLRDLRTRQYECPEY